MMLNHRIKRIASIQNASFSETLGDLRRLRSRFGSPSSLPTETDLQGAAKAINRLQDMYRLNVSEFSQGKIAGMQTAAELTAKDTFYLGRYAATNNDPQVALRWLEEAVLQVAAAEDHAEAANATVKGQVKQSQIEQVRSYNAMHSF